jgi:TonB-linked SusC/RagA family outer membrane protein
MAFSQRTITGKVTDATNGDVLIGVNIVVQGTADGTSTGVDGSYSINVGADAKALVFSYTGYTSKTVTLGAENTVNVTLEESSVIIDELVVVGYGVQKKSDLTGSVASLSGKELTKVVVGNPTSALQGKLSGVQVENNGGQPGGDANVFVRGVSSLTNSFPLYVIDGTFADNMNFINPKDIASMEVLKDASAAAIYGSRAANGVVIITTKRGEENSAPVVSVDIRAGSESPSKMLDYLNGSEFVAYRNQLETNDGTGFVLADNGVSTDWQDLSLNSGTIQDYGVSVSGGGENSKYFISGNYYNQDGILVSSGFERYNLRANSQFNLGKLTITESISFTQAAIEENNWFGFDGATAPILRQSVPGNDGGFEAPNFDDHNFGGLNDYAQAVLEENMLTRRNVLGNINFAYEIVDGLTAKLNLGADYLNDYSFYFTPTFFMSESDAVFNVNQQNDLTEARSETFLTLVEPTLSYAGSTGNSNFDVVVGLTRQKIDFRSLAVYSQGLPNNDIRVTGAAAPANVQALDGVHNVSGLQSVFGRVNYNLMDKYLITATIRRDASSKFAPEYRVGYFPSASLGWKVSNEDFFPKDGPINSLKIRGGYGELGSQNIPDYAYQSVFSLNSNTSFGGAIVPGYAQTSFALEDLKWETARTTNIGFDMGFLKDKITLSAEYYNKAVDDILVGVQLPSTAGVSVPVIQNAGSINNSGFEFEAIYRQSGKFNYTIGVNLSTFNSVVTSLPNPVLGPSTSEDLTRVNRFIEGEAPGVYWGYIIDGVYADQAAIDGDANIANDPTRKSLVQPGDFIRRDINGDGIVDINDQTVIGDPTPDFIYGINFAGEYQGLDFGIFFQGVQGNEIYNLNKFYNVFWADDNKLSIVQDAWTPSNTNTDIPRATTTDQAENRAPSSFFVEDGSYFRLRTLEVGYTVDVESVSWVSSMRIFLTGQNLFTITSYSGYDPDISSTNGGRSNRDAGFYGNRPDLNPLLGRGLDARAYPNTRGIIFGIQANF